MMTYTHNRANRKLIELEAETLSFQEDQAQALLQTRVVRYRDGAKLVRVPVDCTQQHFTHLVLTKRLTIYNPYTGARKLGHQAIRGLQFPILTGAWLIDSLVYGFTRNQEYGKTLNPIELIDLIKYPGRSFKKRAPLLDTDQSGANPSYR